MGGICEASHFREASTLGAETFSVKDAKMLMRLNAVESFEYNLPFYRLRIDKYEGCVKRFVSKEDNNTVSLR